MFERREINEVRIVTSTAQSRFEPFDNIKVKTNKALIILLNERYKSNPRTRGSM